MFPKQFVIDLREWQHIRACFPRILFLSEIIMQDLFSVPLWFSVNIEVIIEGDVIVANGSQWTNTPFTAAPQIPYVLLFRGSGYLLVKKIMV